MDFERGTHCGDDGRRTHAGSVRCVGPGGAFGFASKRRKRRIEGGENRFGVPRLGSACQSGKQSFDLLPIGDHKPVGKQAADANDERGGHRHEKPPLPGL